MEGPENKKLRKTSIERFGADLLAGGASGIVSKTVAAPVERVKILLQTQKINSSLTIPYRGPIDCIKRVLRNEGIWGFWRGNLANVYRYFPNQALTFAFKDKLKEYIVGTANCDKKNRMKYWLTIYGNLLSAGIGGAAATTVSYPFELARTRLAVDIGSKLSPEVVKQQYKGTFDCLAKTYRAEGIRGVYSGFAVSLGGVAMFRAGMIGGYDVVKFLYDLEHSDIGTRLLIAQAVTIVVGTALYPVDTVRRRLMVQKQKSVTAGGTKAYSGAVNCFVRIVREEGWKGLFQGLSMNLVRSFGGALLLVGYDEIKKLLHLI